MCPRPLEPQHLAVSIALDADMLCLWIAERLFAEDERERAARAFPEPRRDPAPVR